MKSIATYTFCAVAALIVATALGFALGSLMHNTVARVMHVVATI